MEIKGTKLFDGFVFLGKDFLDKRSRVDTLEHLKDIDPNTIPEGFRVFVQDTKTWYEYDPEFHSEITGHWKTAEGMEQMDSTEFVYAIVDSEGKVLSGIRVDGTVFNPTLETGGAVFSQMEVDEFLWAVVDTQGLVLFGIKKDGSLYAPKGIPDEVQERFDELSGITVLTNTDNWLFAFVDPNDTVIWGIQPDGSVYQGKGIPDEVQSEFDRIWSRLKDFDNLKVLENTGVWLLAITDTENKVVWGIEKDGTVYTGKGISEETKAELDKIKARLADFDGISVLENTDNWLFAIQDTVGNILFGIEPDGTIYQGKGIPEDAREWLEALDRLGYKVMSNETYIYAICDADGNVLFGIDYKGRSVVNGIDGIGTLEVVETDTFVYAIYDSKGNILFAILKDGTTWMSQVDGSNASEVANEYLKTFEDEEFIHIVNDKDGLIVFGVRWNGEIYIPKGMSEDAKAYFKNIEKKIASIEDDINYLKTHGKDWSDEESLILPMPRTCARVEIWGTIPTSKFVPQQGTLTYSDFDGNSFTKPIFWNVQGNISAGFDKKNWSIDLLNIAGDEDSEFSVQFGSWVPQDSFHLKSYISDFWKIRSLGVYRLAELISQYRPYYNRRPWDSLFGAANQTAAQVLKGGIGDVEEDTRTGAMGRPDGFPFMLYINGKPYGLYTWNLKKHKDNYHITKNDNDGKQLFFGDYMTGVFERYNNAYWAIRNRNLTNVGSYEKWDATKAYNVGQDVYDEETFDFEVGGKKSSVTIRRLFRLQVANNTTFAGYEYDEQGFACQRVYYTDEDGQQAVRRGGRILLYNTMRPSYINWRQCEVRNPKKTICRNFIGNDEDGNPQYQYEYYNYDSPNDYSVTGIYERSHEIISEDQVTQKEITGKAATGEEDNFSKKEYTRSCNTRATLDLYSRVIPILHTTLTAKNYFDWGFLGEDTTEENYQEVWDAMTASEQSALETQVKKQIFSEHHDVDHNLDFFIIYNATYYIDSITHNTLYTMYDGKHIIANLYDTDISMGMGSTYINSFPGVQTGVAGEGLTSVFTGWLYKYYADEIKARWKEYRDNGVISAESFSKMMNELVESVGVENYKLEAQYWSQPSYRTPVYWRMPAGSLIALEDKKGAFAGWGYNEDNNSVANMPAALKALYENEETKSIVLYDNAKQYVSSGGTIENMYCVVETVDKKGAVTGVHWYQCTANCKGQDPTTTYTCGSPTSGGVLDSPRRCLEWFKARLTVLDTKWSYTPEDKTTTSSIPASVIDGIING